MSNGNGSRPHRLAPATLAVHGGRTRFPGEPLSQPPVLASVYHAGAERSYAREGNPTWRGFEEALTSLEGGADSVAFSSGMAAAAALIATFEPGARIVVADSAHIEVRRLLADAAAGRGLRVEPADAGDPASFRAAVAGASAAWIDSITNPMLDVAPIDAIAAAARASGVTLIVDATLATPILQRPLALGADAVLHSASKYLGGHSDLLLGAVATREPGLAARLRRHRESVGATPGTMEAWLALRGLRTLDLRLERGQASAVVLARRLGSHPEVLEVRFPPAAAAGPGGPLAGRGAMISFTVAGGAERADAVCESVGLILHAGSLGGVETLIERHARWHDEPSVPPGLLRLSVGCEHPDDLWRDLDDALRATSAGPSSRLALSRRLAPASAA
jgi:cystathionine gamma-synthase